MVGKLNGAIVGRSMTRKSTRLSLWRLRLGYEQDDVSQEQDQRIETSERIT